MCSLARIAALVAAFLLVAADAASAQGFGFRRGPLQALAACVGDYRRLCPGVVPGGGRIAACLNAQAEKLSQPCFQALAERGLALTAALRLCRADYERVCARVPTGRGRALACLLDNRDRLSPACRNALTAHGFETDDEGE
jgi:hypothetical protein